MNEKKGGLVTATLHSEAKPPNRASKTIERSGGGTARRGVRDPERADEEHGTRRPTGRYALAPALRAAWRVPAFVGLTLLLGLPTLASRRLPRPLAPAALRWRKFALRAWARGFLRINAVSLEVEGETPEAPFFLVSNHLGYVDMMVLAARLDDAVFVAQHEVAGWPLIGALGRAVDTVFVDRGNIEALRTVNQEVGARLDAGRSIVLFPEGTSTPGRRVEPFLSPVLDPAVRRGMPVWACAIDYETPAGSPPAHLAICWWGDMTFPDHALALFQLPAFRARVRFVEAPRLEANRKALARALHSDVAQAFRPTAPGESA